MTLEQQLFAIERGFWEKGEPHFRAYMDEECLISFADMAGVKKNADIAAMAHDAPTWSEIDIAPCGFVHPTPEFALINYEIGATRKGGDRHRAIVTSGYVHRGDAWKVAFHGQALLPD
jgi:hypothetical protein